MTKVFLAVSLAPDRLVGHVKEDGKIIRSQVGLDDEIGHVNLRNGHIFEQRFGPDKKFGHVDLVDGKVYLSRFGPDKYVGQVMADGRMYYHVPMGRDDYVGQVESFVSYAHSGGAFLLLVLPALEDQDQNGSPDQRDETAA